MTIAIQWNTIVMSYHFSQLVYDGRNLLEHYNFVLKNVLIMTTIKIIFVSFTIPMNGITDASVLFSGFINEMSKLET